MKERLTGAIILVAVFVLLVPELLSGPVRPSPAAPVSSGTLASNPSEEPPLRSYTINLADDARSRAPGTSDGSATPAPSGPAQPTSPPQLSSNPASSGSTQADDGPTAGGSAQSSDGSASQSGAPSPGNMPPSGGPRPANGAAQQGGGAPAGQVTQSGGNTAPRGIAQSGEAAQPAMPPLRPTPRGSGSLQASRPPQSTRPAQRTSSRPAAAPDKTSKSRLASAGPSISAGSAGRAESTARTLESASGAGESASGWVVQLGVFASRANAQHLAQEMKAKGFRASVSDVTTGSRALYRVRVGPAADRTAAQELQGRLRSAGQAGTVVPHS